MSLIEEKCTNCGAKISFDNNKNFTICQYCGMTISKPKPVTIVTNEISNYIVNAEKCQYLVEIFSNVDLTILFNDRILQLKKGKSLFLKDFSREVEITAEASFVNSSLFAGKNRIKKVQFNLDRDTKLTIKSGSRGLEIESLNNVIHVESSTMRNVGASSNKKRTTIKKWSELSAKEKWVGSILSIVISIGIVLFLSLGGTANNDTENKNKSWYSANSLTVTARIVFNDTYGYAILDSVFGVDIDDKESQKLVQVKFKVRRENGLYYWAIYQYEKTFNEETQMYYAKFTNFRWLFYQ